MSFADAAGGRRLLLIFIFALRIIILLPILITKIFAAYSIICCFVRNYEIIVMLTRLRILFLRSDDSAAILFIPLTWYEALSIYD